MKVRRESGEVITRSFYELAEDEWGDVSRQFPKLEEAFQSENCLRYGTVGNAPAQLCDAAGMLGVMERIYRNTDGRFLYADSTPLCPQWYRK
jgi:aminoglycoside N3'-acetyltransferase